MSKKQKRSLTRILLAAVLFIAAFLAPVEGTWKLVLYLLPYLLLSYDVLWEAVRNILRGEVFDENFLMGVASIGAFAIGDYPEAVAVMLFYQVGELFQSVAVGKSRRSFRSSCRFDPITPMWCETAQNRSWSPRTYWRARPSWCARGSISRWMA